MFQIEAPGTVIVIRRDQDKFTYVYLLWHALLWKEMEKKLLEVNVFSTFILKKCASLWHSHRSWFNKSKLVSSLKRFLCFLFLSLLCQNSRSWRTLRSSCTFLISFLPHFTGWGRQGVNKFPDKTRTTWKLRCLLRGAGNKTNQPTKRKTTTKPVLLYKLTC